MADNDVLIQIRADVADINAKLADVKGYIGKVTDETNKMASEGKSSWEMFAAGIASAIYIAEQAIQKIQQFVATIAGLADAYGQAELSGLKLNAVLSAHNVGDLTEEYKSYAKEVENLTGIHHTEIENLQSILTTMGVIPSQMKPAVDAAVALHNVFGKDLTQSAELVGQALEGNFQRLQRIIPALKGAETGSLSASDVLKILKDSLGDVNEQISEAYITKIEKFSSSWKDFKETVIAPLIPLLSKVLDSLTNIVKQTPALLKMALMNPGEVLPLPGEPGSPVPAPVSTDATLKAADARFIKPPSHLLDALMKQWRERSAALQAQTFSDMQLTGAASGTTGQPLQFTDQMSSIVAQAAKLKEQFKLVPGSTGVINDWLFGQLHAEDIKESLEMLKTSWEWFEKSDLLQERTAMNKVMNDELLITKDLNEATRQRGDYEITERQLIEANIAATQKQIQAETDRWNAMRPPKDADDWTALNAQGLKIDELREKLKNLNDQLARTSTPQTLVVALKRYTDEAADVWKQYADAATTALKGLEDVFVDLCKTGKLNFTNLADSIISDLIRIQLRANITGPLSSWISGLFSVAPAFTEADFLKSAKGNAFQNGNVIRLALGGIVNRPTLFKMASGAGLMGEAGPEAVMPLARDSSGRLGVATSGGSPQNIQVQIINQSGSSVKATQSKATFDGQKTVVSVVIDALGRNAYGLRDAIVGVK